MHRESFYIDRWITLELNCEAGEYSHVCQQRCFPGTSWITVYHFLRTEWSSVLMNVISKKVLQHNRKEEELQSKHLPSLLFSVVFKITLLNSEIWEAEVISFHTELSKQLKRSKGEFSFLTLHTSDKPNCCVNCCWLKSSRRRLTPPPFNSATFRGDYLSHSQSKWGRKEE